MEKIQGVDFARPEIFILKVFCGFSLIRREGVDFPDIRNKGLINVYFMIIRPRWGNVVDSFFGEDRGR